jgi:hypothetical protein
MATRRTKATQSTEVAITEPAGLPDLVATGSEDFQVDARDIQPPRIKAGSGASSAVGAGSVPLYSLYTEKGRDDDNPVEVVPPLKGSKYEVAADGEDYGFLVHVLKIRTNLAATVNPLNWQEEQRKTGELRTWEINDPSAPPFAKRQYNLVVYAPDSEDRDLPHNLLLKGARGASVGRRINTLLMQRTQQGLPLYTAAFRFWSGKAEGTGDGGEKYHWGYPEYRQVQATVDNILAAQDMYVLIQGSEPKQIEAGSDGDQRVSEVEPAI